MYARVYIYTCINSINTYLHKPNIYETGVW